MGNRDSGNTTFVGIGGDDDTAYVILRRAGEYAISKPARETLFNVLPPEQKYKAKNVIDTVIHRGGDASSSWIFAGLRGLGLSTHAMTWWAVPVAGVWAAVAFALGRAAQARQAAPVAVNS